MKKPRLRTLDIVLLFVCVVMMFFSYMNIRKRKQITEVKNLPFTNASVENVKDGSYISEIQTTFLCIKLEVVVQDNKITSINVLEKSSLKSLKEMDEQVLLGKMIKENKAFVEVEKDFELPSLVYICCVDKALSQGLPVVEQDNSNEN